MSRENKCIKDEDGKEYWISRSAVVIPIVFHYNKRTGKISTLLEKRGPAVSHSGEWCCPCGYLDWDEDFEEACSREVREETGLNIDPHKFHLHKVSTDKNTRNQTIDLWHYCWIATEGDIPLDASSVESKDEIEDLKWLEVGDFNSTIGDEKDYFNDIRKGFGKWAFKGHPVIIEELLKELTTDASKRR